MDASPPVLYSFRRCPYAMRARLALAVSEQVCELREVTLKAKPAELLQASTKGTVPVLVLPDGKVLDQSLDIMHWALGRNDPGQWLTANSGQPDSAGRLIDDCDRSFKLQLDRYKYPGRYAGCDALVHRSAGAHWLADLNLQLAPSGCLYGPKATLADMAIAPFVRQFAQTDLAWFEAQDWPHLRQWLARIVSSELFERTMHKYPAWESGTPGALFPPIPA
jgi:glutathione S-transferase